MFLEKVLKKIPMQSRLKYKLQNDHGPHTVLLYADNNTPFYCWVDSNHDNSTRKNVVMRLMLWVTPLAAENKNNNDRNHQLRRRLKG